MSQKTPQCSAAALLDPNKPSNQSPADSAAIPAAESPNETPFAHQNGGTSSSPESGSSNGDTKPSGKRRRGKKSTRKPETPRHAKTEDQSERNASPPPPERRAGPLALRAECADVWFQRSVYERAESLYQCWLANSAQAAGESNGSAASPPNASAAGKVAAKKACRRDGIQESSPSSATNSRRGSLGAPEEGHRRPAAPPTPVSARPRQRAPPPPTTKRALNGLSPVFAEMFRDVWLEKPLYDRAEAAFYQNAFGNNSRHGSSGTCRPRSGEAPAPPPSEEQQRAAPPPPPQAKAEVFHALHPIQEEDESPAETLGKRERLDAGAAYFLHPDGERVWLDKWRHDAAETRFHARRRAEEPADARRPKTDTSMAVPPREKYDASRRLDKRSDISLLFILIFLSMCLTSFLFLFSIVKFFFPLRSFICSP